MERRASTGEIRAAEDGKGRTLSGYAAVFDSLSEVISGPFARGGGFREKISRDAFSKCLRSDPNVVCLVNHDPSMILGRTPNTLSLRTDNTGLRYTVVLPDTQQGNSIWESVRRKDIVSSSFGFTAEDDSWSDDNVRTLRQVVLHDVSPVVWPAYSGTTVSVRNTAGTMESVAIGWYRPAAKLSLPLTEREMKSKVRKLRRELRQDDDDDCSCDCQSCAEDGDCSGCNCEMGCDGTGCGAGECNCLERQASGRMRPAQGRTIAPVDRIQLMEDALLTEKIWLARKGWRRW